MVRLQKETCPLADPGGAPVRAPPTGSNSFVFPYVFAKSPHVGGRRPPPPQWEILDPLLLVPNIFSQEVYVIAVTLVYFSKFIYITKHITDFYFILCSPKHS